MDVVISFGTFNEHEFPWWFFHLFLLHCICTFYANRRKSTFEASLTLSEAVSPVLRLVRPEQAALDGDGGAAALLVVRVVAGDGAGAADAPGGRGGALAEADLWKRAESANLC